jgi:hypothetical protein
MTSAGYFSRLDSLSIPELIEREKRAAELLTEAEERLQQLAQRLIEGAAERVATGDQRAYEDAERAQRMAAMRVADCRAVLAQVQSVLGAAREAAFGKREAVERSADASERRRKLLAELERAQFQLGQATAMFEESAGVWLIVSKPHPHPSERRLTILGQNLKAALDQARGEVDRIRSELRSIDQLLAA